MIGDHYRRRTIRGKSNPGLYEGRDLAPTTDLRAVLKGVRRDHFGFAMLQQHVMAGLVPGIHALTA
jgi:uncharacterized protein (DUF1501 family)